MSYVFHTDADPAEIKNFVVHSDQNTLFQCPEWIDIKNNWGHMLTSVTEDGKIVASALVLIHKMPLGKTLFYVPRGPVMDYHNPELVAFMLDHLKAEAKKHHAIALRFDPKVYSRRYPFKEKDKPHPYENQDVVQLLKSLGAKHRGYTTMIAESTQPRFNAEMDVEPGYFDHLDRKTIRSINTAIKKGAEVYCGHEYLDDFSTAMHYTEMRKEIALRNKEYFRNMLDVYGDNALCLVAKINFPKQINKLKTELQEHEDALKQSDLSRKQKGIHERGVKEVSSELEKVEQDYKDCGKDEMILCGVLAVYNENLMEIFYMGNNPKAMRIRASYLLYNECLKFCEEHHIHECSFGGVEGTLDDGLTTFKANFLMNVEEYIGEFNIILDKPMYTAFNDIYPFVLKHAAKIRSGKKETE